MQNARMVGQAFCESTDGGIRKNTTGREDKSISKIFVYVSEDKSLLLP